MVRFGWLRCRRTPMRRPARKGFGKYRVVAAEQFVAPPKVIAILAAVRASAITSLIRHPLCARNLPNLSLLLWIGALGDFSHSGQTTSLRTQLPLSSPPIFLQTRSLLGHPRCCTWAGVEPLRTRLSQHPLGHQFQGVSFWPHPGNQASQQRPCSGSAQESPLANVSRQGAGLLLPGT